MRLSYILFIVLVLGCAACSGGNASKLEKIKLALVSEGPLFNGSNTATGIWKPAVSTKVKSARFTSVTISGADSSLAGLVGNLVLQIAAPEADMKKIAFIKGNAGQGQLKLLIAEEQKELEAFFRGQEITFVIDYDLLPEEYAGNLRFNLEFDAELITE